MSILGQFQFRRDTAANWTSVNPILLDGELGIEVDTDKFKIGDGVTAWNSLPYGGIKGDTGEIGRSIVSVARTSGTGAAGTTDTYTITYSVAPLTSTFQVTNGANGNTPTVSVGTTTVVTPAVGPSVSDADAGPNVDLRFNLPRARNVSAGTTNTITPATSPSVSSGADGNGDVSLTFNLPRARVVSAGTTNTITPVTSPSVSSAQDGNGDVSLTFNLPRARAVSAGTTTTGNPGTNASVSSANDGNGDVTLNFTIPRGDVGPAGQSVAVSDEGSQLTATASSLNFVGGGVTATNTGDAVTVTIPADAVSDVLAGLGLKRTVLGTAITLASRDTDYFFHALDYGVLTDGSDAATVSGAQATQNRTTIQAAIDAAQSSVVKKPGGIVILPPGTYHIDATLTINVSSVILRGAGRRGNTDIGSQTGTGTTLFWNNTASPATTAMIDCVSIQGAGNAAVKGVGVQSMNLQCAGNVGIGIRIKSIHWGDFKDLYIINATSEGLATECFITGTELGEAADVTKCTFDNIGIRMLEVADTAKGFSFDGATNANTSNSTFRNLAVSCKGAQIAIDVRNTDSNRFYDTVINQSNGGTVQPIVLRGSTAEATTSRGNMFFGLASGGSSTGIRGLKSEGTDTAGVTAPAMNNVVYGYSIENGEPAPLIGTGSVLEYYLAGGAAILARRPTLTNATATAETVVARWLLPENYLFPGRVIELNYVGQGSGTATVTYRIRVGTLGTVADAVVGTTAASAAGTANSYSRLEALLTCITAGATGTAMAQGRIQTTAASAGPAAAAFAAGTVNTTARLFVSITTTQSAAQTLTSRTASLTPIV